MLTSCWRCSQRVCHPQGSEVKKDIAWSKAQLAIFTPKFLFFTRVAEGGSHGAASVCKMLPLEVFEPPKKRIFFANFTVKKAFSVENFPVTASLYYISYVCNFCYSFSFCYEHILFLPFAVRCAMRFEIRVNRSLEFPFVSSVFNYTAISWNIHIVMLMSPRSTIAAPMKFQELLYWLKIFRIIANIFWALVCFWQFNSLLTGNMCLC